MTDSKIQEGIEKIIKEGGHILLEAKDPESVTSDKDGHANFVTAYDKKSQQFLEGKLRELLPEANFVGEENGEDAFKSTYKKGYAFVIDPIDGTTNFIYAYRPSMISIGLLKDGKPFIGVVYNPYTDELFSARKGMGSTLNGKPIHVSKEPMKRCLISFGTTPYQAKFSKISMKMAYDYLGRCADLRRSGSAAYDLCKVACGSTVLFFEMCLGLWDYCAGALIVTEAGGKICDIYGKPIPFRGPSSVVARAAGVKKSELILLKKE